MFYKLTPHKCKYMHRKVKTTSPSCASVTSPGAVIPSAELNHLNIILLMFALEISLNKQLCHDIHDYAMTSITQCCHISSRGGCHRTKGEREQASVLLSDSFHTHANTHTHLLFGSYATEKPGLILGNSLLDGSRKLH